jgi:ferredoxin/flavodoxin---NADP+ reductase
LRDRGAEGTAIVASELLRDSKSAEHALILTRNRLEGPPFAQVARPTDELLELDCGLVFRSIGYRGVPICGLPFNQSLGTVPHAGGRVLEGAAALPGLYVTGWLKRGPTGIIGTNRADSAETVASLLADLTKGCDPEKRGAEALRRCWNGVESGFSTIKAGRCSTWQKSIVAS